MTLPVPVTTSRVDRKGGGGEDLDDLCRDFRFPNVFFLSIYMG